MHRNMLKHRRLFRSKLYVSLNIVFQSETTLDPHYVYFVDSCVLLFFVPFVSPVFVLAPEQTSKWMPIAIQFIRPL